MKNIAGAAADCVTGGCDAVDSFGEGVLESVLSADVSDGVGC